MKNLEELKKEQDCLKEKLVSLIKYINSEEYFSLSITERNQLNQERLGMEMQLNAMTNRLFNGSNLMDAGFSTLLPLLMSVLSTNSFSTPPTNNNAEEATLSLKLEDVQK